ncbi:MAG: hypothetical protein IPF58_06580 [Saprospirales bacterium]|nr:hypothetical protein [Saprospirales bacterium]
MCFLFVKNVYDAIDKLSLQTVESDVQKSKYEFKIENENTIQQICYDTMFNDGRFQITKKVVNSIFSTKLNPLQKNITGFYLKKMRIKI